MKHGLAEIDGRLVPIDDERISEFSEGVLMERAQYGLRQSRGIMTELAATHAGHLATLNTGLYDEFNSQKNVDSTSYGDITSELLGTAVQGRDEDSLRFLDAFTYMWATRAIASEYGPDSTTGFKLLHSEGLNVAEQLRDLATRFSARRFLGWNFPTRVTSLAVGRVLTGDGVSAKAFDKLIMKQGAILEQFEEQLHEATYGQVEVEDFDEDFDDELESEGPLVDEFRSEIDIAVIKVVKYINYSRTELLKVYDPEVIRTILVIGSKVLRFLRLLNPDKGNGELFYPRMPDVEKANCRPGNPEGADIETFFPSRGQSIKVAQSICKSCKLMENCSRYALVNNIQHGVWGNTSERERRRLRRQQRSSVA